ncbi:unannotated protein [freshwater metagenome]|jgi:branched-chain amino acid transport system permease protein|uniref:Unannotated protein n=1 Tax=freshwater metagenome TaxID=449393 RepID=A0A6J7KZI2_9ZZZZ
MISLGWVTDRPLRKWGLLTVVAPGVIVPAAIGLTALILAAIGGPREILVSLGVSCTLAVAYQIFVGATGIISFGHMAFVAVGAYTAGLVTVPPSQRATLLPDLPAPLQQVYLTFPASLALAAAVCALLALLSGLVLMRMSGVAAGIGTLGLLVIVNEVIRNSGSLTRGTQTFFGVPANTNLISTGAVIMLVTVLALLFKFSRFGIKARAGKDDDLAYETLGGSVIRARIFAWVLSGALTGVGGALMAQQLTAFSPSSFFIIQSVPIIVIVVLGGINSVAGSLLGAVVYVAWIQIMLEVESGSVVGLEFPVVAGIGQLTIGVALILVLRWRPLGLLGSSELGLKIPGPESLASNPEAPAADDLIVSERD